MSVAATTPAIIAHTWLAPKLSPQNQTPIKLAQSIITSYFPSQVHIDALQAKLTENQAQNAAAILQEISDLIIQHEADPFAALEKISKYLNLEVVNGAVRSKPEFTTFEGGIAEAKKHLLAAERLIETLYPKIPFSVRQAISSILYSIHSVIAGLLGVFGFKDFVKTTQEGPMEGGLKAQKLFILVILFSALATIIMPVAGQLVGAAILGGILLGLIVLTAVYPYIAPTPRELSRCKNWTQLINEHKLPTITGRDAICDSIAGALTSSNEQPLILGKSGAGKTASAQAFAHAVHEGKYPQLKGKSVFYLNAGDLLSSSITGSDNILKTIQDQIGRSSNNVIIVLDEIHTLFKNPNNPIAQQLKSMLDRTQAGSFKYVVGITTEKEYKEHVTQDEAFCRRWKNITLPDPSQAEIIAILNHHYLRNHANTILPSGVIQYLYEYSSRQAQLAIADKPALESRFPQPLLQIQILDKCLALTSSSQSSETQKDIDAITSQIESLVSSGANGNLGATAIDPDTENALAALRADRSPAEPDAQGDPAILPAPTLTQLLKDKASKQTALDAMKPQIAKMNAYQKLVLKARVHQAAICTLFGREKSKPMSDATSTSFALLTGFLIPGLEAKALAMAGETGNKIKITPEIIQEATRSVIGGILAKADSDEERRAAAEPAPTPTDLRIEALTSTVAGLVQLASTPTSQSSLSKAQVSRFQEQIRVDPASVALELAAAKGESPTREGAGLATHTGQQHRRRRVESRGLGSNSFPLRALTVGYMSPLQASSVGVGLNPRATTPKSSSSSGEDS